MPRYYFNYHDGVDLVDPEGMELPDLAAARIHARAAAAEMVAADIAAGKKLRSTNRIEV